MRRNILRILLGSVLMASAGCDGSQTAKVSSTGAPATPVSVEVVAPATDSVIRGNVAILDVRVRGVDVRPPDGDRSGKTGHFEVFVDLDPVQPGQPVPTNEGIVRAFENRVTIPGLTVGEHKLTIVVADGSGHRLTSAQDEVTVTVRGPSVKATTAPGAGRRPRLTLGAEGVEIADVAGDTSGTTGHLHFFIDREPTPAGTPIPDPADGTIIHTAATSVEFPAMARGEHVIWVVLGDANHIPFEPPVMDRVVVVVD